MKTTIILHLSLAACLIAVQMSSAAPPVDDDEVVNEVIADEGRSFGVLKKPLTFASSLAHRLGYFLDPSYVALGYGGASLQPEYSYYPGIGYPNGVIRDGFQRSEPLDEFPAQKSAIVKRDVEDDDDDDDDNTMSVGYKYRY